jgi:alkylhydroperoxidase family enzyme
MAALIGFGAAAGITPAAEAAATAQSWPARAGPARLPRITPAEEDSDEVRRYFAMMEGPGGRKGGTKLNLVLTLARYPELAMRYHPFGMHVLNHSSLSPRLRELVTCRTAWLYRSDYEWTKHAARARKLGVTDAEIATIRSGRYGAGLAPLEVHALSAADQLYARTSIDDKTWAGLAAELDDRQLLDLLFLIGSYAMLAMVLNGARVQNER